VFDAIPEDKGPSFLCPKCEKGCVEQYAAQGLWQCSLCDFEVKDEA
jgi:ribosomal protein L37AE/L43A